MCPSQIDVVLRRFESPDEMRVMEKGKFEVVRIGGLTVGRATYEPGWRWSEHVGPTVDAKLCTIAHVGLVVSGTATAALEAVACLSFGRANCSHPAGPARQLGCGERAVCLFFWARAIMRVAGAGVGHVRPRDQGRVTIC